VAPSFKESVFSTRFRHFYFRGQLESFSPPRFGSVNERAKQCAC
jgi:hypothetical protein